MPRGVTGKARHLSSTRIASLGSFYRDTISVPTGLGQPVVRTHARVNTTQFGLTRPFLSAVNPGLTLTPGGLGLRVSVGRVDGQEEPRSLLSARLKG